MSIFKGKWEEVKHINEYYGTQTGWELLEISDYRGKTKKSQVMTLITHSLMIICTDGRVEVKLMFDFESTWSGCTNERAEVKSMFDCDDWIGVILQPNPSFTFHVFHKKVSILISESKEPKSKIIRVVKPNLWMYIQFKDLNKKPFVWSIKLSS